jgi:xanthine/uracil permease
MNQTHSPLPSSKLEIHTLMSIPAELCSSDFFFNCIETSFETVKCSCKIISVKICYNVGYNCITSICKYLYFQICKIIYCNIRIRDLFTSLIGSGVRCGLVYIFMVWFVKIAKCERVVPCLSCRFDHTM